MTCEIPTSFDKCHQFIQNVKTKATLRNLSTAISFAGTLRYSEVALKAIVDKKDNNYCLSPLKFLAIGKVGICTYEVAKKTKEFSKISANKKIDAALSILSNLSSIGYSTETFLRALTSIHVISPIAWLSWGSVIGAALESAAIASDVKGLMETLKLKNIFDKSLNLFENDEENSLKEFQNGMKFIQQGQDLDEAYISKNFFMDASTLNLHLQKVETIAKTHLSPKHPQNITSAKKLLNTTMQDLSARVDFKQNLHMVSIAASTLDIIAVRLLFSRFWPLGYGLFATAGWMSLGITAAKSRVSPLTDF